MDDVIPSEEHGTPSATASELANLVNGNSAFAFDLYRALAEGEGNIFFSPYSISLALAMTYAGARGETERQMADTMHYLLPQGGLHAAFNHLGLRLASRGSTLDSEDAGFRLNMANAVWGQRGYGFLEEFLDVLAEHYEAGVRPVDFEGAPEESRVRINEWVAGQTEDRVRDLIPPGIINPGTRFVLTNAIYFKARWLHTFDENATRTQPFHLLDGRAVDMPMMSERALFGYASGKGYQAVDMPYYLNGELSMTLLLPDEGRFREFEDSLDAQVVRRILADLDTQNVLLTMPKFGFESDFRLDKTLEKMGMPNAFNHGNADFSGIDGRSCPGICLVIAAVLHKAFVSVDEEGTEAAAATAVIGERLGLLPEPVRVTADRPFIFLVRDRPTGTVLFLGRVELTTEEPAASDFSPTPESG